MRLALLLLLSAASMAAATLPDLQLVGTAGGEAGPDGRRFVLPDFGLEMPAKSTWPELVGRPCADAKAAIEAEVPGVHVFQVPEHSMVTMDYRTDRVRIFCSQGGTVAAMPRIG